MRYPTFVSFYARAVHVGCVVDKCECFSVITLVFTFSPADYHSINASLLHYLSWADTIDQLAAAVLRDSASPHSKIKKNNITN
jgi:hypothetical protein